MANTLNLGDGNWGVKDSSLLGYAKDNTKFVPETFDVTRASGGTRVNKDGLIDTPTEILSGDLVINGDFATDSDWTKGSGWSISGGSANFDSSVQVSNSLLSQSFSQNIDGILNIDFSEGENSYTFNNGTKNFILNFSFSKTSGADRIRVITSGSVLYFSALNGDSLVGSIDNVSVKEYNDNNLARIDYTDGVDGVLLTEPQSTNLITDSEDFSDSSWTKAATGTGIVPIVTSNYGVSPDGTQNADRIQFDLNGGTESSDLSYIAHYYTATGVSSTISIYLKSLSTTKNVRLRCGGTFLSVDVTNSWQRFDLTDVSSSDRLQLLLYGNLNSQDADLLVWGAQGEALSYPTSYMPTYGAIASRAGDVVNNGGDATNFNSEEGVLYVEIAALANDGTDRVISLNSGSFSNRIQVNYTATSNQLSGIVQTNGAYSLNTTTILSDATEIAKIAIKYKENDFAIWIDGVEVASSTSGNTPIGLNNLDFSISDVGNFYGKTKNIQVFNEALSDAELQTLTTI